MGDLRPNLGDIRFSFDLLSRTNYRAWLLSDGAHRALMTLVASAAAGLVWTYSAPGDGSIPDDDVVLARVVGVSKRRWKKMRPELEPFFKIRKGQWHLNEPWIEIDQRVSRAAIPIDVQQEILRREGRRCTYCADTEGPFDFDHILPVSRGGKNDPSNLTLACASCNRSKGGKTLREWFEWSR